MTTVSDLERRLAAAEKFIASEAVRSADSVEGRTSSFWAELFQSRPNYPDICAFLGFRRDNFGYGMADERQGGLEKERLHLERNAEIFRWSVDPAAVDEVDEPTLGAPFVFEAQGIWRSAAFWVNAATAHRVRRFVNAHGRRDGGLRVLEIGAGWGASAYQLHHLLPIANYTIVDLPENLLLSTTYLASTLGRNPIFIESEGLPVDNLPDRALAGLLPGALPRLGMAYDLILNSFSLQEMDRDTVDAYLSWIESALSDDGIFVSINAHGKAGVRRPSEYHYERFHIHHIGMFRRFPSGFENTIPWEMVVSRRRASELLNSEAIETLCCLHQFGLDQDIYKLTRATVDGSSAPDEREILSVLHDFFTVDPACREAVLAHPALQSLPNVAAYLEGQHRLVQGETEAAREATARSLELGLSDFAAVRAAVTLAILSGRRDLAKRTGLLNPEIAYPDVVDMLNRSDTTPIVRRFNTIMAF